MSAALVPARTADPAVVAAVRRRTGRRRRRVLAALALLVLLTGLGCLLLGGYTVTLPDLVRIVTGTRIPGASFVVLDDKLPRVVVGLLAGAAFGVSGATFQTMLRNPLASPDVIGVSAGASTAAVVAVVVLGLRGQVVGAVALGGALVVALAVWLLSRGGAAAGSRLVLVGIGVAAMLQAVTTSLLSRSSLQTAAEAFVWLNGSLGPSTWPRAGQLALWLVVLLPLTAVAARHLPALELGPDAARGLGVPTSRARGVLLLLGVALAAVATAATGPIAFVAFLAGPVARRAVGEVSLVGAALTGAAVVLLAELASTTLVTSTALPVGVVTGALGAPCLVALLVTTNRSGRGG